MAGYPTKNITQEGASIGRMSAASATSRSEVGIGAMMPWANRLYFTTYLADTVVGDGGVLAYIDQSGAEVVVDTHNSCHTGRMVHSETNQLLIGEYVIGLDGTVHKVALLAAQRISSWARHMSSPTTKAYACSMGSSTNPALLWEVDLTTWVATQVANISTGLGLTTAHVKAMWTAYSSGSLTGSQYANTRLLIASNVQYKPGDAANSGVLATWDGTTFVSRGTESHIEIGGNYEPGSGMVCAAVGMDHKSPFLVYPSQSLGGSYFRYRFPAGTHTQDYYITQEWMRIRPVQTERLMLNAYGTWFQLSPWFRHANSAGVQNYGTIGIDYPLLEPIGRYVDTVTDYCVWNGRLVIGTNNQSEQRGYWPHAGQSQSCLKFGDIESLQRFKPVGTGYLFYKQATTVAGVSDPMLMRGYGRKTLYLKNDGAVAVNVTIKLIDYSDSHTYGTATGVAAGALVVVDLTGVDADWFTLTTDAVTASFSAWVSYR
jgi:hypothetical protein